MRTKVTREERKERVTRTRVRLTGEPLKEGVQEALGMATLVHLSSQKCGWLMILSQRCRPKSLRI